MEPRPFATNLAGRRARFLLVAGTILACCPWTAHGKPDPARVYPEARRSDRMDDYHGTQVADPYRWLEADVRQSEEVATWVEAENALTFAYL